MGRYTVGYDAGHLLNYLVGRFQLQLQIDLKGLTAIAGGPPTFVKGEGAEAVHDLDVLLTRR